MQHQRQRRQRDQNGKQGWTQKRHGVTAPENCFRRGSQDRPRWHPDTGGWSAPARADAALVGFTGQRIRPPARRLPIGLPDFLHLHFHFLVRFQVVKTRGVDGRQIQFIRMHHVQEKNFKFPVQKAAQGLEGLPGLIPKIRQHDQPPALFEEQIALGQRGGRAGVPGRLDRFPVR